MVRSWHRYKKARRFLSWARQLPPAFHLFGIRGNRPQSPRLLPIPRWAHASFFGRLQGRSLNRKAFDTTCSGQMESEKLSVAATPWAPRLLRLLRNTRARPKQSWPFLGFRMVHSLEHVLLEPSLLWGECGTSRAPGLVQHWTRLDTSPPVACWGLSSNWVSRCSRSTRSEAQLKVTKVLSDLYANIKVHGSS